MMPGPCRQLWRCWNGCDGSPKRFAETDGEALIWQVQGGTSKQDQQLIAHFVTQAERGYQTLLAALDQRGTNGAELARRYQQVRVIDYFHAPSRHRVRSRVAGAQKNTLQ
jgi:hypothetical protein